MDWDGGEEPCGYPGLRSLMTRQGLTHRVQRSSGGGARPNGPHGGGGPDRAGHVSASADGSAGQREPDQEGLGEEIQAVLADTGRAKEARLEGVIRHRVEGVIPDAKPGTGSGAGLVAICWTQPEMG